MTSPTDPPKESIRDRVTRRLSTDSSGRYMDADAQRTRNVTWLFAALIVGIAVIIVVGLAYGFWESNLKPLANVAGTDIGRGQWEERQKLQQLRVSRAEDQVRAALVAGDIDSDLADRRLSTLASQRTTPSAVMEELVDLVYQEQLAEAEGISVSDADVEAAMAADGSAPEARRLEGLVLATDAQLAGGPSTPEELAELRERAEAARAELEGGAAVADIVEEYAIEQVVELNGDFGYVIEGDITDPDWNDAIFSVEEGGITPIIEGSVGELLIGVVTDIVPVTLDQGFAQAARDEIGEGAYRRNIELEATAAALEAAVIADVVERDYDQVRLAEILIEGDTFIDPADDEGAVRASHILYQPEAVDDDGAVIDIADLPEDDPAWDAAEAEAVEAAEQLRAVEDLELREWAFARRAREDSDGPTGVSGGDLGFFGRMDMLPEFADAVFDADDPQPGDIIGPVRTEFGWHVIKYDDFREPLAVRLEAVQAALAEPGAEFAAVAAEYSDGSEAADGGETGWAVKDDLDELTVVALDSVEVGEYTEAVDGDRGYYIYQKLEEATRPLDEDAAAALAVSAFLEWYDEQRFEAEDAGEISIDGSVYEDEVTPGAQPALPMGGHGG